MYNPSADTAYILDQALSHVRNVQYQVTARWVFYRLLQDGTLTLKADYKRMLGYLSKARKEFYGGWTPYTLADDTRAAVVRGGGYETEQDWLISLKQREHCNLDMWPSQSVYVEIWFEASAMEAQFRHYAHDNISLLAFHGDVSIPEKWRSTERLVRRWQELQVPIKVLYYGDLDEKGLQIPESAKRDVELFAAYVLQRNTLLPWRDEWKRFLDDFEFRRVGLDDHQIVQYGVVENPERPGTYQWEGVDDAAAEDMINEANDLLDQGAFDDVTLKEDDATDKFRDHLDGLQI